MPHYATLDGLRAVPLVAVLLRHYNHLWYSATPLQTVYQIVPNLAIPGLDVFFALSGFLITGILLDTRRSASYFRTFYMRRVLRILPPYYAFLAVWFFVLPQVSGFHDMATPWPEQAWYWLHALNVRLVVIGSELQDPRLYHLWSLAFEEQFYLLWPAVVYACSTSQLLRVCAAAFTGAFLFRVGVLVTGVSYEVGFVLLPGHIDTMVAGAVVAVLVRDRAAYARVLAGVPRLAAVSSALVLGLMVWRRTFLPNDPVILTVGMSLSAVCAAAVVAWAVLLDGASAAGRVLRHPAIRYTGRVSYAAYIWHWPLETVLNRLGLEPQAFLGLFASPVAGQLLYSTLLIGGAVGLGGLSWVLIEVHCLKLKRFFPYGMGPRTAGA